MKELISTLIEEDKIEIRRTKRDKVNLLILSPIDGATLSYIQQNKQSIIDQMLGKAAEEVEVEDA